MGSKRQVLATQTTKDITYIIIETSSLQFYCFVALCAMDSLKYAVA